MGLREAHSQDAPPKMSISLSVCLWEVYSAGGRVTHRGDDREDCQVEG